jgi:hypothetical protein
MQTLEFFLPYRCVREALPPPRGVPAARVRAHLAQLLCHLELARATVVSSSAALRHQNCELDADVANVLQRHVAEVLGTQIERLEQILAAPADESE